MVTNNMHYFRIEVWIFSNLFFYHLMLTVLCQGEGRGHSLYKGIQGCAAGMGYVFTSSGIY